jgi:hypothetical protein
MPTPEVTTRLAAEPEFEVGLNYPIPDNKYGWWIGPPRWGPNPKDEDPRLLQPQPWWVTSIGKNLKLYKEHGVSLVRMFLLSNLTNYGRDIPLGPSPSFAAAKAGVPLERWDWEQPSAADPRYAEHFGLLLEIFRGVGVRLIPSFLDFYVAYVTRSRILKERDSLDLFSRTVLAGLVTVAQSYRDTIFAWEIINEPFWCSFTFKPDRGVNPSTGRLSTSQVSSDIGLLLGAVEKAGGGSIPATVGHRFLDDFNDHPAGDVHQFHYYARSSAVGSIIGLKEDPKILPTARSNEFMILGEADIADRPPLARAKGWPELNGADLKLGQTVRERCDLCRKKRYPRFCFGPILAWITGPTAPRTCIIIGRLICRNTETIN